MPCNFGTAVLHDFKACQNLEWLETNGIGGWASSTISGAHTRRYHGLLVAATKPPTERFVTLSKLDETIITNSQRIELGCNQFRGAAQPNGHKYIKSFTYNLFPYWEYHVQGIRISKTIAAIHDQNTVLVIYEVLDSLSEFQLEFLPLVTKRFYHQLLRREALSKFEANFDADILTISNDDSSIFIAAPGAEFKAVQDFYYNFQYLEEQRRGYDFEEDLFSPGKLIVNLKNHDKLAIIISTSQPNNQNPFHLFQIEQQRRMQLAAHPAARDDFSRSLHLAADQFIVKRYNNQHSILAGYHWFTDWGRDAMIALPGLCLVTGKFELAKSILLTFAKNIKGGLIPNCFSDGNHAPKYNSIDATLWFFVAIYKTYQYTKDQLFIEQLLPVLYEIIDQHLKGTFFGIHVTSDGLLAGGSPDVQLTWMDAKVGNWVVTPRTGKAVEVNALWCNALFIIAELSKLCAHQAEAVSFDQKARLAVQRFNEIFWNGEADCLFDYIDQSKRDDSIRPNQVIALALPFEILNNDRALKILSVVEKNLLTPYGLRTLQTLHANYQGIYAGNQATRDSAYHQGTVWPWLLGPFISALVRYHGNIGKVRAQSLIEQFKPHLNQAGIGSISEIFDGHHPHIPRGAIAQAWSVAEILRAYTEDILGVKPEWVAKNAVQRQ